MDIEGTIVPSHNRRINAILLRTNDRQLVTAASTHEMHVYKTGTRSCEQVVATRHSTGIEFLIQTQGGEAVITACRGSPIMCVWGCKNWSLLGYITAGDADSCALVSATVLTPALFVCLWENKTLEVRSSHDGSLIHAYKLDGMMANAHTIAAVASEVGDTLCIASKPSNERTVEMQIWACSGHLEDAEANLTVRHALSIVLQPSHPGAGPVAVRGDQAHANDSGFFCAAGSTKDLLYAVPACAQPLLLRIDVATGALQATYSLAERATALHPIFGTSELCAGTHTGEIHTYHLPTLPDTTSAFTPVLHPSTGTATALVPCASLTGFGRSVTSLACSSPSPISSGTPAATGGAKAAPDNCMSSVSIYCASEEPSIVIWKALITNNDCDFPAFPITPTRSGRASVRYSTAKHRVAIDLETIPTSNIKSRAHALVAVADAGVESAVTSAPLIRAVSLPSAASSSNHSISMSTDSVSSAVSAPAQLYPRREAIAPEYAQFPLPMEAAGAPRPHAHVAAAYGALDVHGGSDMGTVSHALSATSCTIPWSELSFAFSPSSTLLGSGSYGTVRRAEWRGADVAVKTLLPIPLGPTGNDLVNRFFKEASLHLRLRHPHIVPCYGVCEKHEEDGHVSYGLLMELQEGGSLQSVLQDKSRDLPVCDRIRLLKQIAAGLLYLHSENIVHGDLKSQNVLLDEFGKAKLSDFGFSNVKQMLECRERLDGSSVRPAMGPAGSILWIAPEQFFDPRIGRPAEAGSKTDVFSFGITMWEVLTRSLPYEDIPSLSSAAHVSAAVNSGLRPSIAKVPSDVPLEVIDLMQRCWSGDRGVRPTMKEALAILTPLGGSKSERPRGDSSVSHLGKDI
jgi:hypothetical protein